MDSNFKVPTETVELPSKGLLYPADSPLSSGKVEMKYMTAREEDILSNLNFIRKGTAIDKLMQSLLVDKNIDYKQLLIGDKNAIMVAARILSYGKEYTFTYDEQEYNVDLSTADNKELDEKLIKDGKNEFPFKFSKSGNDITFKFLTHQDEISVDREVEGKRKINKDSNTSGSTRLKYLITSINGQTDNKSIRDFVDNYLLASEARELRKHYGEIAPDVELKFDVEKDDGSEEAVDVPIGVNFFWPDVRI